MPIGAPPCDDCPRPKLLPELAPIGSAFVLCDTQWRYGARGATGLDYTACKVMLATQRRALGLPPPQPLWEGLRVIEHGMLTAWAERMAADDEARAAAVQRKGRSR